MGMEDIEAILETGAAAAVEVAASALSERGDPVGKCANCGHPLIGPYCAVCGQPHNTHRRSVGHLLHEFFKDIASFDSRILRTVRALLIQPGELPLAFREGRTQRYMPAVRLYLFVSLAFFLFLSLTGLAFVQFDMKADSVIFTHDKAGHVVKLQNGVRTVMPGLKSDAQGNITAASLHHAAIPEMKADGHSINATVTTGILFFKPAGQVHSEITPAIRQTLEQVRKEALAEKEDAIWLVRGLYNVMLKLQTDPAALNRPLTVWIPRILFVLLPLFALLLAAFYRRRHKDFLFVDHLVFSLTVHSFAFVTLIFAAAAAQLISGDLTFFLTVLVLSAYFLISLRRFYGQNWAMTVLKSVSIAVIYAVFFLGPALAFALIASAVGG
jgi:hypothetical protein